MPRTSLLCGLLDPFWLRLMTLAGLTLPSLTVADPPVAGEGSLDPLGTGALADRIAEQLVPDVRARMSRVRFLTAMAISSIVTDEVGELLILDGRATPPQSGRAHV